MLTDGHRRRDRRGPTARSAPNPRCPANALLLAGPAVRVITEAVQRRDDAPEVATGVMLAAAVAGAVANVAGLLILRGGQAESLNLRGASLEVPVDLVGSVAVIGAGVVIAATG